MFSFNSVSEDCQLEIFKYLPLKDRVLFELVTKEWKRIISRVWKSQRALSLMKMRPELLFCALPEHRVFETDSLSMSRYDVREESWRLKILKRCPNLTVLVLDSNWSREFNEYVRENCNKLEHIGNSDDILNCNLNDGMLQNLRCAKVYAKSTTFQRALALKRVERLHIHSFTNDDQVDQIIARSDQIVQIKGLSCFREEQKTKLCENMKFLKSFHAYNVYDGGRVELIRPQREIYWNTSDLAGELTFRRLLQKSSDFVNSVQIAEQLTLDSFTFMCCTCPNIKHLDIMYLQDLRHSNVLQPISKLKQLRSFEVMMSNFHVKDIKLFFEQCPKLTRLRFAFFNGPGVQPVVYLQFICLVCSYARRHPKRAINLRCWFVHTVNVKFKQQLFTDITKICDIPANLRLQYK